MLRTESMLPLLGEVSGSGEGERWRRFLWFATVAAVGAMCAFAVGRHGSNASTDAASGLGRTALS